MLDGEEDEREEFLSRKQGKKKDFFSCLITEREREREREREGKKLVRKKVMGLTKFFFLPQIRKKIK